MDLGEGEVIDASQKGSILRFVNHSCGPNAETQKWTVQGKRRIGLFATEVIEKGTEVRVGFFFPWGLGARGRARGSRYCFFCAGWVLCTLCVDPFVILQWQRRRSRQCSQVFDIYLEELVTNSATRCNTL